MPTEITVQRIYASELLDFVSSFPAEGQALIVGSTGRLEGANVVTSVNSKTGDIVLTAEDIGLGNVDNTSDADKPISTAVQAALDTKADVSALMAHVEADDNPHDVSAAQVGAYTTAQVDALISAITYTDVGAAAAEHFHTISDVTGLQTALDSKADASHVSDTNNPHEVTAAQVGAYTTDEVDGLISSITYTDVGAAAAEHLHTISDVTGLQTALDGKADASALSSHMSDTSNPHGVTAEQVGAAAAVHTHEASEITDFTSAVATHSDVAANTAARHVQNTDTGTTSQSFQLDSNSSGVRLKHIDGALHVRNSADSGLANLHALYGYFSGYIHNTGGFIVHGHFGGQVDLTSWGGSILTITGEGVDIIGSFLRCVGISTSHELAYDEGILSVSHEVKSPAFTEANQPLRERYVRHFLNLESKDDLTTLDAAIGDQATVRTGDANDPIHRYELVGESLMSGPEVDYTDVGQPEGWPVSFYVRAPEGWPGPEIVKLEWVAAQEAWQWMGNDGDLIASCTINILNKLDIMFLDLSDIGPPGFRTTDVLTWPPPNDSLTVASSPMGWDMSTVVFLNQSYAKPAQNLANWRRIVTLDADGEIKGPILHRFVLDTDDTDVARIGEIVCVVDDLDNPTTVSYRMGDGTTKTANLPEIATVTP